MNRFTRAEAALFAFSLCTLACGSDAEISQTADWTVGDSAGVTLVSNQTDGSSRGCVTISPDPETTMPSNAASPPLYRVRGGAVLDDGRIAVLNAGNKELLFFGADGWFLRGIGRSGSGPGEFVDPRWLGQGGDDTLFVWDGGLMRLSTFDGVGELLSIHQVRFGDDKGKPIAIRGRFDDGSFFFSPGPLMFFDGTPGILRFPETYGRYHVEMRDGEGIIDGKGLETVSGGERIYPLPFGKEEMAIAHGDVLAIGDNGTSTLRYYDLQGELRRVVEWESKAIPITNRDKTAFHEYRASLGPSWQLHATARFADDRPRFSSIMRDQTGWLWLRSYTAGWEPRGHWLLFDEDGVLRCSVEPPPVHRFRPLQIGETYILAVQRNEDGEETVVLHALVRNL